MRVDVVWDHRLPPPASTLREGCRSCRAAWRPDPIVRAWRALARRDGLDIEIHLHNLASDPDGTPSLPPEDLPALLIDGRLAGTRARFGWADIRRAARS
ncbi:MAG: hypothetical protein IRZ10_04980 [Thermoflavifilum sp.]|nr:hypothetical protein [Thermoflavifilum sp.]MCL6513753.1 hypothetical protein [Alicyclobacillus sp.]